MLTHGHDCRCLACRKDEYIVDAGSITIKPQPLANTPRIKEAVLMEATEKADSATKALKKALKARQTFPEGTVVRWLHDSYGQYTYVAVFAADKWYTTSANGYVPKTMDTDTLLQWLSRSDVSCVAIAAAWNAVTD